MLKSLSLFSGCLGLDSGLSKAGIKSVAYVDKDPVCQLSILANDPKAKVFDDVFGRDVIAFAKNKRIDIVAGGPPCQSFSTIGQRRFLDDPRGFAIKGYFKVVQRIRPAVFLLENVHGIISANGVVEQLSEAFDKLGYFVDYSVLNCADFGVPQIRKRFVMIGSLDKSIQLSSLFSSSKIVKLRETIEDLEDNPGEHLVFSKKLSAVMKRIPEGGNWKSLSEKYQDLVMGSANRKSGGLTGYFRRLSYDKPSPTLLTSPTHRATTLGHPTKNRPLSVLEYKRIQCFPDDWVVCGSVRDKYRQIGNAVPVLFGKALGKLVAKSLS